MEEDQVYVLMPMLVQNIDSNFNHLVISISSQLLLTKNAEPQRLWNIIDFNVNKLLAMNYDSEMLVNSTIVLKYRTINLDKDKRKKISESVNETKSNIRSKLDIVNYHGIKNNSFMLNGKYLPLTMNTKFYGKLIKESPIFEKMLYLDKNKPLYEFNPNIFIYVDSSQHDSKIIHECIVFKKDIEYLRFKDLQTLENNNSGCNKNEQFIRKIGNLSIKIEKFEVKSIETTLNTKFITELKRDLVNKLKVVTYDIETYVGENGIFIPYACGWYNGIISKTYYLTDFNSPYEMLLKSISDMINENNKSIVYVHNLSHFDYLFLSKPLFENFHISPIYKDSNIISLNIYSNENKKSIVMYDSYLILPASLKKLAITFKVDNLKGIFPYSFVNKDNLNYFGELPSFSYFNDLTEIEYNNIRKDQWSLRNETITYLESDLKALYQVIIKFAGDIYENEKVDISKCPTNSSIAFKIFRTNYINNMNFPIIKGLAHQKIRNAYFGGVVEVYKNIGHDLKLYDVNSLYPFAMLNPMPVDKPIFSTDHNLDNYFGIVYVSVNTLNFTGEKNKFPLLPLRIDNRMYNVLGYWTGWYFSEEVMTLAQSLGYEIKVHYGCLQKLKY